MTAPTARTLREFVYRGHVATRDRDGWEIRTAHEWVGWVAGSKQDARHFIDVSDRIPIGRDEDQQPRIPEQRGASEVAW